MNWKIINKIGPYNGPFEKNITTFKLKNAYGNIVAYHAKQNRPFNFEIGDIITGVCLNNDNTINYKKSKIKLNQLKIW